MSRYIRAFAKTVNHLTAVILCDKLLYNVVMDMRSAIVSNLLVTENKDVQICTRSNYINLVTAMVS